MTVRQPHEAHWSRVRWRTRSSGLNGQLTGYRQSRAHPCARSGFAGERKLRKGFSAYEDIAPETLSYSREDSSAAAASSSDSPYPRATSPATTCLVLASTSMNRPSSAVVVVVDGVVSHDRPKQQTPEWLQVRQPSVGRGRARKHSPPRRRAMFAHVPKETSACRPRSGDGWRVWAGR